MATQTKSEVPVKIARESRTMPAPRSGPLDEFDRLLDQLWPRGWLQRWERPVFPDLPALEARLPKLDVIDRDNEIVVKAEVPGVDKEDVQITLSGNRMTIKGETRREEKEEKGDYYRCEISRGTFSRTVVLPAEVDDAKARAAMRDGMLEVTLPKVEQARKRDIRIE